MRKIALITGVTGQDGSYLAEFLLKKKYKIIGTHRYKKPNLTNLKKLNIHKKINSIFHFGEFSRIYQSFKKLDECLDSNLIGSKNVFSFCLENNIRLIYSATSASLGNKGQDKNLSPYAFSKAKNLELLENLKKWFNLKYEIIYFYNVYGNRQIKKGEMATVIGIFENQYKNNKPLTVVKPGNQTRRFTHISDTIKVCYLAWKKKNCNHYSITHRESFSIMAVAKMFKSKIKMLPERPGERYASSLTKMSNNNQIIRKYGRISLKDYITSFIKEKKK